MTAVGSALTYAHQKGVLHRDIKPSNIIIDRDNVPYVADFGLARIAQAGESTMSADMLLGTPHYMSPEQAKGQKTLDGRTDIYSLGVVMYELVVGRVPFSADTPYAIIHDHIYSPLPLPTVVNPDIPERVEMVLLKALAKDPVDRYETANDMVNAFRDAVQQENLNELRADRVSVAAVSLARLREQQDIGNSTPARPITPSPVGVPAPFATSPVNMGSISLHTPAKYGRLWMFGGIVAFLMTCFLSSVVTLSALDNIGQFSALTDPVARAGNDDENTFSLYDVPALSLANAHAALETNPEDFLTYLALARGYWQENQTDEARNAIQVGRNYAEGEVLYLLTAANIAAQTEQTADAGVLYIAAYDLSNGQDTNFFARGLAGEFLYTLALQPNSFNTREAVQIAQTYGLPDLDLETPIVGITSARVLISNGQYARAQLALRSLLLNNSTVPEVHLVWGELQYAQGDTAEAIKQWEFARDANGAPLWVKQRAEALLNTTKE
jgi:tetratricopeptide (TPR) repeat protein